MSSLLVLTMLLALQLAPGCARATRGRKATPSPSPSPSPSELAAALNESMCLGASRGLVMRAGELAPLPGDSCGRLRCEGSERTVSGFVSRYVRMGCSHAPGAKCKEQAGDADAPYPDCCPRFSCDTDEELNEECLEPISKRTYKKGDRWALPDDECGYMECKGSVLDPATNLPSSRFMKHACRKGPAKPSCSWEPGLAGSAYPFCCPRELCKPDPD